MEKDDEKSLKHLTKKNSYEDISVKIGTQIYRLDRILLALKSNYFEKLFIGDFAEKNSELVEIHAIDNDTFSTIIDIVEGQDLKSAINADNYVELLMAMDYLEMSIDLSVVRVFLYNYRKENVGFDVKMFKLCHLINMNLNYKYLYNAVHVYLSRYLADFLDYEDFVLLPFENIVEIIKCDEDEQRYFEESKIISQICAEWICHDLENRLKYFADLVSAANCRMFQFPFKISNEAVNIELSEAENKTKQEVIQKYFYEYLNRFNGLIDCESNNLKNEKSSKFKRVINRIDEHEKLSKYLKNRDLYDITIEVKGKIYKLHKSVLKRSSEYFIDLICTEHSKSVNPSLTCPDKDYVYKVENTEIATFEVIVNFMYFGKIWDSNVSTIEILKTGIIFKISKLIEKFLTEMKSNIKMINGESVLEVLNYAQSNGVLITNGVHNDTFSEMGCEFFCSHSSYRSPEKLYFSPTVALQIWRISKITKLKKLTHHCENWLMKNVDEMSCEHVTEMLNFTFEKKEYEDMYAMLLCHHINATWPEIRVHSQFCSIPCEMLADILSLSKFLMHDPSEILDICSKWIVHDVERRYSLIPRIAMAINHNKAIDYNRFGIEMPTDWSTCSQQFVKDMLWKVLQSTSFLPSIRGMHRDCQLEKTPLCIMVYGKKYGEDFSYKVKVVDNDLNEITSLNSLSSHYFFGEYVDEDYCRHTYNAYPLSAVLIADHLFTLCAINEEAVFQVYNLSTKKILSLAGINHGKWNGRMTLLNCRNEIYCCFSTGRIAKYSIEFNRWKTVDNQPPVRYGSFFVSDGNSLYRMSRRSRSNEMSTLEIFDFEQNTWSSLSDLPDSTLPSHLTDLLFNITYLDNKIVLLFSTMIFSYNLCSQSWSRISVPVRSDSMRMPDVIPIIVQSENNILFLCDKEIHQCLHLGEEWMLKRVLSNAERNDLMWMHAIRSYIKPSDS